MMKLILRGFDGRPKRFFKVLTQAVSTAVPVKAKTLAHLIMVVDASGSMYSMMKDVRTMVEKIFTIGEYKDADLRVSLISYASMGDVVTHINRARVEDVLAPNSSAVAAIRNMNTRGLTCISQGLNAALGLLRDDEATAVVLHSDGFANDRSPGAEKREIDGLVAKFAAKSNVLVNTVAYAGWSDFALLSYIANACSGLCFQSPTAKELYNALEQTVNNLAGNSAPAIEVKSDGADTTAFVSKAGGKVIGLSGGQSLLVRGVQAGEDATVYRFVEVDQDFEGEEDLTAAYVYSAVALAQGDVNASKYALVSTRDTGLLADHARALTVEQVASYSTALQTALFASTYSPNRSTTYGLPNANQASIMAVLNTISRYPGVEVDLADLVSTYRRRSERRVAGVRVDGKVIPPRYVLKTVFGAPAKVADFAVKRDGATVNMRVVVAGELTDTVDNSVIKEKAGISLNLSRYNNYTLVSDGALNVASLRLKLGSKRLFGELQKMGAIAAGQTYNPTEFYTVDLSGRPMVAYTTEFSAKMLTGKFDHLAKLTALASILSACTKDSSCDLTAEQIAALAEINVTKSLYYSAPTVFEHEDRNAALAAGLVDSRISYQVTLGSKSVISVKDLYSANEYLARRFEVVVPGLEPKAKAKFEHRFNPGVTVGVKALTARTKLNGCDAIQYPIMADFLRVEKNGACDAILKSCGATPTQVEAFYAACSGKASKDDAQAAFSDALDLIKFEQASAFGELSELVAFIGSTGTIPDDFGPVKAMTGDEIQAACPDLSISKTDAANGSFFLIGDSVLSVIPTTVYFSTSSYGKVDTSAADEE